MCMCTPLREMCFDPAARSKAFLASGMWIPKWLYSAPVTRSLCVRTFTPGLTLMQMLASLLSRLEIFSSFSSSERESTFIRIPFFTASSSSSWLLFAPLKTISSGLAPILSALRSSYSETTSKPAPSSLRILRMAKEGFAFTA